MALAAALAKQEEGSSSSTALLCGSANAKATPEPCAKASSSGYVSDKAATVEQKAPRVSELPAEYVVIFTQVLPDGLGDVIFGESAVLELQDLGGVAWIRCYQGENSASGERLIHDTASTCFYNLACTSRDQFGEALLHGGLQKIWAGARERFLAPWIFGLSAHEEALLGLATRTKSSFWALTEYGRSMGNIHTYTGGLGCKIPTGWSIGDIPGRPSGVFKTIRRAPTSDTNWHDVFAGHCGVAGRPTRLWWFYSRGDDEKKHDIKLLEDNAKAGSASHIRAACKLIPVSPDGKIIVCYEKTSGEKLAEQLFEAANDPNFKPNTDVSCAEVTAGTAGQLSQFLWGILYDETFVRDKGSSEAVDIIVAPNLLTQWRESSGHQCVVAHIQKLGLLKRDGSSKEVILDDRTVFLCSTRMPRTQMRTFLEQCEEQVFTTGDQSFAEALFLGKDAPIQPDAKVQQWQIARKIRSSQGVDSVPDLGAELRRLVTDENARKAAQLLSKLESDELEKRISMQLGGGPSTWNPTHQILVRAGMLG